MLVAEMKLAAELRKVKYASKAAKDEPQKLKARIDKYKEALGKAKKENKNKEKKLTKPTKSF